MEGLFDIRVTSNITGFSPAVLRQWELRYGYPKPARGSRNWKYYTEEDVERLKVLKFLIGNRFKPKYIISKPLRELLELKKSLEGVSITKEHRLLREAKKAFSIMYPFVEHSGNLVSGISDRCLDFGKGCVKCEVLNLSDEFIEWVQEE